MSNKTVSAIERNCAAVSLTSLADQLAEHATKEQLVECARILALNVAHYASRYGELPIEEHLDFLHTTELGEEQARMVIKGMEAFVGVLGNMLGEGESAH